MLEGIARVGRRAPAEDEFGSDKLVEPVFQRRRAYRRNLGDQAMVEFASDGGGDLGDLLGLAQPVQPRLQRIVER